MKWPGESIGCQARRTQKWSWETRRLRPCSGNHSSPLLPCTWCTGTHHRRVDKHPTEKPGEEYVGVYQEAEHDQTGIITFGKRPAFLKASVGLLNDLGGGSLVSRWEGRGSHQKCMQHCHHLLRSLYAKPQASTAVIPPNSHHHSGSGEALKPCVMYENHEAQRPAVGHPRPYVAEPGTQIQGHDPPWIFLSALL